MSRKHRDHDLAGWYAAAANSEAGRKAKRRPANADFAGMKPSRQKGRKGRGK
jgi:hypothetical protein